MLHSCAAVISALQIFQTSQKARRAVLGPWQAGYRHFQRPTFHLGCSTSALSVQRNPLHHGRSSGLLLCTGFLEDPNCSFNNNNNNILSVRTPQQARPGTTQVTCYCSKKLRGRESQTTDGARRLLPRHPATDLNVATLQPSLREIITRRSQSLPRSYDGSLGQSIVACQLPSFYDTLLRRCTVPRLQRLDLCPNLFQGI